MALELDNLEEFTSEEDYAGYLDKKLSDDLEKNTQDLLNTIMLVSNSMVLAESGGEVVAECRLSNSELQVCSIKIPALCTFLQAKLSGLTLHSALSDVLMDVKISQTLKSLPKDKSMGTAAERTKAAELEVAGQKMANVATKQYIKSIQDLITRADKVYEGIKKTLDYRGRELWFDGKNTGS